LRIPFPDPRLVERGMFHALAARDEVAVDDVDRAVLADDRRRVVIASLGVPLEMAGPFPGLALVVRKGHGQAGAAADSVIVDEDPVTALELRGIEPRSGVG